MANPRNLVTKVTIQNLIAENNKVYATKSALTATDDKVNVLIGSDTNKSVRAIANEELASQLIPANAEESLDTLQEIAAWIQAHPGDAATMNAAITALQNKLVLGTHEVSGEDVEYTTVKSYVEDSIANANLSQYALQTTLESEVADLEDAIADLATDTAVADATPGDGIITVGGRTVTVYTLPATVLQESDIVDFTAAEIAALITPPAGGGE